MLEKYIVVTSDNTAYMPRTYALALRTLLPTVETSYMLETLYASACYRERG